MVESREYKQYLISEVQKPKPTWYEKLVNGFGKIPFEYPVDRDAEQRIRSQADFVGYEIKPSAIYTSAIFIVIISIISSILIFLFTNSPLALLVGIFSGAGFAYYIYSYLPNQVKFTRIRATSDLLLSVLYMVISLRITPNLENAVVFASANVSGNVGRDLKKIVWDMSLGKYTGDDALEVFAKKWREENDEFSEAIDIIRTSVFKGETERLKMYEEAVNVILERNSERMKTYSTQLNTPVTVINYMGITLPVLTVILFPIMTIFLSQAIRPHLLVLLYNVALPLLVYWMMIDTLKKRPISFGAVDISTHPDAYKIGTYRTKNKIIPLLPISFVVAGAIISLGYLLIRFDPNPISLLKIGGGLAIVWGVSLGIIIYSYFSYRKNIKIKQDIVATENEFTEALYELGLILSSGYSVETSIEKLLTKIRNLKISFLFTKTLNNVKELGMTIQKAIFDPKDGVIKYYPSKLIKNVLQIFVEALQRGSQTTAVAMMSVSGYLKSVRRVEDYLKEILQETTSEMQFMLAILVPVALGIIVALAGLLTSVLVQISQLLATLTGLSGQSPFSQPNLLGVLVDIKNIVPIEYFVIIVGVYMIEVVITLAMFLSALQYGEDPLEKHKLIANGLFRGMLIFSAVSLFTYVAFSGLVKIG